MQHPAPDSYLPLPHLPYHVLLALASGAPAHGWAIIKRIEEVTDGAFQPSTGSLYLAMGRLEDRGLLLEVAGPEEDNDARRRYYTLSALGTSVLNAETRRLAALVAAARAADVI